MILEMQYFIEEDQLQREGDLFTKSLWDKVRMTKNNPQLKYLHFNDCFVKYIVNFGQLLT